MAEKEYLERGEVKRIIKANNWLNPVIPNVVNVIVDRIPAADVVEVRHGEWVDNRNGTFTCSFCGGNSPKKRWCGDCGAKMDGKGEGE